MTIQLERPARTITSPETPAPTRAATGWLSSVRATLRHRRAHRSDLARAIASYPATRSALVLPVGSVTRVDAS